VAWDLGKEKAKALFFFFFFSQRTTKFRSSINKEKKKTAAPPKTKIVKITIIEDWLKNTALWV